MPGHRVGLEAGLDGDLRPFRIENPIRVEAEIAVDGDGDVPDTIQNLTDALLVHPAPLRVP